MRFTSVLALLTATFAPALASYGCNGPIRSTVAYTAALTPHGGACPSATAGAWSLAYNGAGCCQSGLQIHSVGVMGAACCPCGAFCTGFFPNMVDWSEKGGENRERLMPNFDRC
jgi:hypothetical protein